MSVPSNIVEGKSRSSNKEYARFLFIARGSLEEVKYQLFLARDLSYIDDSMHEKVLKIAKDVGRLLNGLIVKVEG